MAEWLEAADFLKNKKKTVIIDVRSPSEYGKGHIPGSLNIPLFDDRERAEVGTLYTQKSRDHAILRGLDIILPKVASIRTHLIKSISSNELLVYCWRGGMRSSSMAAFFEASGYTVSLLHGGYKAYRRYIRSTLAETASVTVLGGFTGSGKTDILHALRDRGEQVIDLEKLASHKGSVFGSLGMGEQPTNEQFENNLFEEWHQLNPEVRIWLEDESRMIGKVVLPDPIVQKIETSPLLILNVPKRVRINRLVEEYAGIDDQFLVQAVGKIGERLGDHEAKEAISQIQRREYSSVAERVLQYYDKAYAFSVKRRQKQLRFDMVTEQTNPREIAGEILTFAQQHLNHESNLS